MVAVFALTAIAVGSASAAEPEYGQCVSQKKGEYTNNTCTAKSAKAHKGHFEWKQAPLATCVAQKKGEYTSETCETKSAKAHKGHYEKECAVNCADFTVTGGAATFYNFDFGFEGGPTLTGLGGTVKCASSTGTGEYINSIPASETITFAGCQSIGAGEPSATKCTTPGEPTPGTIKGEFRVNPVELSGNRVGVSFQPHKEVKFTCGTVADDLEYGQVYGTLTGDTEEWVVPNPSTGVEQEEPETSFLSVITHYGGLKYGEFLQTSFDGNMVVTNEASMEVRP